MEQNIVRNPQTYFGIFEKYHSQLMKHFLHVKTEANIAIELFPIMYVAYNKAMSIAYDNLNVEEVTSFAGVFSSWINEISNHPYKSYIFDKRQELYMKILSGEISPRCEWLFFQQPKNTDGMTNCVIAFGDILLNSECADNYETAPIMISDITRTESFASTMTLCNDIINLYIRELIIEMQRTPPLRLLEKYFEEKHKEEKQAQREAKKASILCIGIIVAIILSLLIYRNCISM